MNDLTYPGYSDNADISVINENFETVAAAVAAAEEHAASKNNPHEVTKEQVGLGNVTNESKATMFSSAALTGLPTAPTPSDSSSDKQIANVKFVTEKISASEEAQTEELNSILSNYASIKVLEQSALCSETNESVSAEIRADDDSDMKATTAGTVCADEDIILTGIGGYPRSVSVSVPWSKTATSGSPDTTDYFGIEISFSDITLQGTITSLSNGYYSATIKIPQSAIEKTTKNTFTFHVKVVLYGTHTGSYQFWIKKKSSWGVSIPKTIYIAAADA